MAQVTLYLDDETHARLRAAAEEAGLSMSAWLGDLVRHSTSSRWPQSVVELAGSWPDAPDADALRVAMPADTERETL